MIFSRLISSGLGLPYSMLTMTSDGAWEILEMRKTGSLRVRKKQ